MTKQWIIRMLQNNNLFHIQMMSNMGHIYILHTSNETMKQNTYKTVTWKCDNSNQTIHYQSRYNQKISTNAKWSNLLYVLQIVICAVLVSQNTVQIDNKRMRIIHTVSNKFWLITMNSEMCNLLCRSRCASLLLVA